MRKLKFWEEKETHIDKTGPREVLWFIGLWGLGVLTITVIGSLIKLILAT